MEDRSYPKKMAPHFAFTFVCLLTTTVHLHVLHLLYVIYFNQSFLSLPPLIYPKNLLLFAVYNYKGEVLVNAH